MRQQEHERAAYTVSPEDKAPLWLIGATWPYPLRALEIELTCHLNRVGGGPLELIIVEPDRSVRGHPGYESAVRLDEVLWQYAEEDSDGCDALIETLAVAIDRARAEKARLATIAAEPTVTRDEQLAGWLSARGWTVTPPPPPG
jgi:hypothetical protein